MSRGHYAGALILCVLIAAGGMYMLAHEWIALVKALEREQVLVRFHGTVLFFPGAMIALVSAGAICVAGLTSWTPSGVFHKLTQWSFVVSFALAVAGMLLGGRAVDRHVESYGYQDCDAKSEYTPLRQHHAWTLHPAICNADIVSETMTLQELKEFLREVPSPSGKASEQPRDAPDPAAK